jgi:hypothetical protein
MCGSYINRDLAYLVDILLAARDVLDYTAGKDREALSRERMMQDAVRYRLAVLGEAVRRLFQQGRNLVFARLLNRKARKDHSAAKPATNQVQPRT